MLLTLANNQKLEITDYTWDHLQAHPEVTLELLTVAASRLTPPDHQASSCVDLYDKFGCWGFSGLVKVESANLFAFRAGRSTPSSVTHLPSNKSSFLSMVTKPCGENTYRLYTAYCSSKIKACPEPLDGRIDPKTEDGQKLRLESLEFWSEHALSLDCTPIDGELFESTWEEVITKYENIYDEAHSLKKQTI
jgi:hypothetical protein